MLLAVRTEEVPRVPTDERISIEPRGAGLHSVLLRYGFMEEVDVPKALARVGDEEDLRIDPRGTTFFLGRENLIATDRKGMALWRERLFAVMSRNSNSPTDYYRLSPNRVVELGTQVEL